MTEIQQLQKEVEHYKTRLNNGITAYKQLKAKYDKLVKVDEKQPLMIDKVYGIYPRKVDPTRAKGAIAKAIVKARKAGKPEDYIYSKTKEYANVLKRYGISSKSEKWSIVPHPSTFYNNDRYDLEEAEWSSGFRDGNYVKEEKAKTIPDEPECWRQVAKMKWPDSRTEDMTWEHFYTNCNEEWKELEREFYIKKTDGSFVKV